MTVLRLNLSENATRQHILADLRGRLSDEQREEMMNNAVANQPVSDQN